MNNWQPIKHEIVKSAHFKNILNDVGYVNAGNIGSERLIALKNIYQKHHQFKSDEGGMFYSVYAKDIEYRTEVFHQIDAVLHSIYSEFFEHYKSVIHSFIVKVAGPKSDFTLHQDSTGLDEFQYSPLSVWIPLQDTNLENGTLCVVPKTHHLYAPYRGISFASQFAAYESVLRDYLVPINLKAGDMLLFDNRLVHYSPKNLSAENRVVVMSGLFPKEAKIWSVYKDEKCADAPLEIYEQSEDFLITNTAFYEHCTDRPYRGQKIQTIKDSRPLVTVYDFLSWAARNEVKATHIEALSAATSDMLILDAPV